MATPVGTQRFEGRVILADMEGQVHTPIRFVIDVPMATEASRDGDVVVKVDADYIRRWAEGVARAIDGTPEPGVTLTPEEINDVEAVLQLGLDVYMDTARSPRLRALAARLEAAT